MKIVIPDYIDVSEDAKQKLRTLGAEIHEDVPSKQELIDRIKDAEIITANYVDVDKEVIDYAAKLKYIVVPAVGYEWVDYKYAATKGIKVLNCPTHNGLAVAEHAIGLIFAIQRKLMQSNRSLRKGEWKPKQFRGLELTGSKLGLVGYGKIAKQIECIATSIGMSTAYVNSQSTQQEWEDLMKNSDVVCVCLPQNDDTKHLVDQAKIGLMKQSAILVNVGRGSTVDTKALTKALKEDQIAGAGVDVYEDEPLSGEPNETIVQFAQLDNVVATPHIAYLTEETAKRLGAELMMDIESCISDKLVNVVN